jgi:hypothetical protein
LLPNETVVIRTVGFFRSAFVQRSDKQNPDPGTGGGGFTEADRSLLATAANSVSGTYDVANQILALLKSKLGA